MFAILPQTARNPRICDLLRQRVLEDTFDIARGQLSVDEFAQLQLREHAVEFGVSAPHDAPNQPERELSAEHSERLQTGPSHRAAGRDAQQESPAPFFSSF